MEELLKQVSEMIRKSTNIPEDIKSIVEAICRGYIRETNGKIPLEGIKNVCETTFVKIDENDENFSTENRYFAMTTTDYDKDCNVIHKMEYINYPDYIKLITILTHELGHIITEYKPHSITEDGIYPIIKKTNNVYFKCFYENENLMSYNYYGFRMTDGFLESTCTKIFESKDFREELLNAGYDLKDYIYKDERLFPSRVYDEYKACYELFNYIMDGKLFDFSCDPCENNQEILDFFNKNKLFKIFDILDSSNDALWALKKYEGRESDSSFDELLNDYKEKKEVSLNLAEVLMEIYNKDIDDPKYKELLDTYANMLKKQKELPIDTKEFK